MNPSNKSQNLSVRARELGNTYPFRSKRDADQSARLAISYFFVFDAIAVIELTVAARLAGLPLMMPLAQLSGVLDDVGHARGLQALWAANAAMVAAKSPDAT
jgi:hypothetical protein